MDAEKKGGELRSEEDENSECGIISEDYKFTYKSEEHMIGNFSLKEQANIEITQTLLTEAMKNYFDCEIDQTCVYEDVRLLADNELKSEKDYREKWDKIMSKPSSPQLLFQFYYIFSFNMAMRSVSLNQEVLRDNIYAPEQMIMMRDDEWIKASEMLARELGVKRQRLVEIYSMIKMLIFAGVSDFVIVDGIRAMMMDDQFHQEYELYQDLYFKKYFIAFFLEKLTPYQQNMILSYEP
jgi:hypothetical protein